MSHPWRLIFGTECQRLNISSYRLSMCSIKSSSKPLDMPCCSIFVHYRTNPVNGSYVFPEFLGFIADIYFPHWTAGVKIFFWFSFEPLWFVISVGLASWSSSIVCCLLEYLVLSFPLMEDELSGGRSPPAVPFPLAAVQSPAFSCTLAALPSPVLLPAPPLIRPSHVEACLYFFN